jgi:hypothetical protein
MSTFQVAIGWQPDGAWIAAATDGTLYIRGRDRVVVYNSEDAKRDEWEIREGELPWGPGSIAITPDGSLALCNIPAHAVSICRPGGDEIQRLQRLERPETAMTAPYRLVVASDGTLYAGDTNNRMHVFSRDGASYNWVRTFPIEYESHRAVRQQFTVDDRGYLVIPQERSPRLILFDDQGHRCAPVSPDRDLNRQGIVFPHTLVMRAGYLFVYDRETGLLTRLKVPPPSSAVDAP